MNITLDLLSSEREGTADAESARALAKRARLNFISISYADHADDRPSLFEEAAGCVDIRRRVT
jgi:hypothetical protein